MDTPIDNDGPEAEEDVVLARHYGPDDVDYCAVCSDLQIPLHECASRMTDQFPAIAGAALHGCLFCTLVDQCARRHQRVFNSTPRRQHQRQMYVPGFFRSTDFDLSEPHRNWPLECPSIDAIPYSDVAPFVDDGYNPGVTTSSQACATLSKQWLATCVADHYECSISSTGKGQFVPKRLLDLSPASDSDRENIALVDSGALQVAERYACLSHCWGGSLPLKLTVLNDKQLRTPFPRSELPKTFQDAAIVCDWLSLRYLWIDALCIMQDSQLDWEEQAFEMRNIYKHATITIAPSCAENPDSGIFRPRHPGFNHLARGKPIDKLKEADVHELRAFVDPWLWEEEIELSLWNSRAWVLQERLLSPRTLNFGNEQIFWQCRDGLKCEMFPIGFPPAYLSRYSIDAVAHSSNTLLKRFLSVDGFDDKSLDHWGEVCEAYMQGQLTNASDRVVAFAGIAEECQHHFGDQYIAGLWRRDLERQLLWKTVNPYEATRPEPLHAPTWSFLCQDSPIEWHKRQMDSKKMAQVLAVDAQLEDDKYPFGSYTTCILLLDAVTVIAGFIEPSKRPQQDNDNYDYILTKRRAPRSQQLRFISEDECFSIEDGSQFWLQLDLAWEFKGRFECVLVPLEVLITVDYCRPRIFGLVLYKVTGAKDEPMLGPLRRLGTFYARDHGACIVGRHETCDGIGCDFEGSETTGEAVETRGGEHYIQMQQESFDAFMTGAYQKTIVLT